MTNVSSEFHLFKTDKTKRPCFMQGKRAMAYEGIPSEFNEAESAEFFVLYFYKIIEFTVLLFKELCISLFIENFRSLIGTRDL